MEIISLSCSSTIFSFFLAMSMIVITTTTMSMPTHETDDILSDVCSKSVDIPYCMQVTKTIPGSSQANDFKNLAQISITYTLAKSKDNMNYAVSLVKQASDDTALKKTYMSCNSSYVSSHHYLEQAQEYFKEGDYGGVNIEASNAMNSVDVCQKKLKDPHADSSQLLEKNKEFIMLGEIIAMVANKIIGIN